VAIWLADKRGIRLPGGGMRGASYGVAGPMVNVDTGSAIIEAHHVATAAASAALSPMGVSGRRPASIFRQF